MLTKLTDDYHIDVTDVMAVYQDDLDVILLFPDRQCKIPNVKAADIAAKVNAART